MSATTMNNEAQLSLFDAVAQAYATHETLSNDKLYEEVAERAGLSEKDMSAHLIMGGRKHNLTKRRVRWIQQTLKHMGLIEHAQRGVWELSAEGHRKLKLRRIKSGYIMLAFSTKLGVALWADCRTAGPQIDQPIHLVLTSPPYPIAKARAYGGLTEAEFVDFICLSLEPIVRNLAPGGSIVLNVSNDVFESGLPSRSLYRERMVIALHDRFGLHKMDEMVWVNKSKAPGPVRWASIERNQLNVGWEPVYWFSNDPSRVRANNNAVLEPHSERHKKFLAAGGCKVDRDSSDGAYIQRAGRSYSNMTAGRIPRNVIEIGHACASQRAYKRMARDAGLPAHGAPFPTRLAEFYIKFLTTEGDLIFDPFAGSLTVPLMAEMLGRHWIATDVIWEYIAGGSMRFDNVELEKPFADCIAA